MSLTGEFFTDLQEQRYDTVVDQLVTGYAERQAAERARREALAQELMGSEAVDAARNQTA